MTKKEYKAYKYLLKNKDIWQSDTRKVVLKILKILKLDFLDVDNKNTGKIVNEKLIKIVSETRNHKGNVYEAFSMIKKEMVISETVISDVVVRPRDYYDEMLKSNFLVEELGQRKRFLINDNLFKLIINKQDVDKSTKEKERFRKLLLDYLRADDYLNEYERNTYLSDILNLVAYLC